MRLGLVCIYIYIYFMYNMWNSCAEEHIISIIKSYHFIYFSSGSSFCLSYTQFTRSTNCLDRNLDCNLDRDPEDIPVYTGHSLFNKTNCNTLLLVVHRNPPNIWIKIV